MTEFHGKFTFTLGGSSQMTAEAEHAVQTAISKDGKFIYTCFGIVDYGIALVQQTDDITLEFCWGSDNDLHERFKDMGLALFEGLSKGLLGCILECHF